MSQLATNIEMQATAPREARRRLIDYTQSRDPLYPLVNQDGNESNSNHHIPVEDGPEGIHCQTQPQSRRRDGGIDMPTFRSLEKLDWPLADTHQNQDERIQFFLKVVPAELRRSRHRSGMTCENLRAEFNKAKVRQQRFSPHETRSTRRSESAPSHLNNSADSLSVDQSAMAAAVAMFQRPRASPSRDEEATGDRRNLLRRAKSLSRRHMGRSRSKSVFACLNHPDHDDCTA